MKNIQKGFIVPFLIIIIVLLGVGGGIYIYQNKQISKSDISSTTSLESDSSPNVFVFGSDQAVEQGQVLAPQQQKIKETMSTTTSMVEGTSETGVSFSIRYPRSWVYLPFNCNLSGIAFWPPDSVIPESECSIGGLEAAPIILYDDSKLELILQDKKFIDVYNQMKSSFIVGK